MGYGFLEEVHQRAKLVELGSRGLLATTEAEIKVIDKGVEVGTDRADLWVADQVIVELKVTKTDNADDEPLFVNELKATGIEVGLLIHLGRNKVESRRLVY